MSNYNQIILLGRLTRNVTTRTLPSGIVVGDFGLATNRRWTDEEGKVAEESAFFDIEVWRGAAETLKAHANKGDTLFVTGYVKTEKWQDKESGENRTRNKVVLEEFQFVSAKPQGETDASVVPALPSSTRMKEAKKR